MSDVHNDRSRGAARRLILLRHGQSEGNAAKIFTGWLDVPLSAYGRVQARRTGSLLVERGVVPDVVHTSVLGRAVDTALLVAGVVAEAGGAPPTVRCSWRLNERHYGVLQGMRRDEARARYGSADVARWRRSYRCGPPDGESLADVLQRLRPWWPGLVADLQEGRTVLVVAHSNSLRALCTLLDRLDEQEVEDLNIPTGEPLRYDLDAELTPSVRGGVFLDPAGATAGVAEMFQQNSGVSDVVA